MRKTIRKESFALIYLLIPVFPYLFPAWKFSYLIKLIRVRIESTFVHCFWKLLSRDYFAYLRNVLCSDMSKDFQGY